MPAQGAPLDYGSGIGTSVGSHPASPQFCRGSIRLARIHVLYDTTASLHGWRWALRRIIADRDLQHEQSFTTSAQPLHIGSSRLGIVELCITGQQAWREPDQGALADAGAMVGYENMPNFGAGDVVS